MSQDIKSPTLMDAMIPLVLLVFMMGSAVYLFEDNSSNLFMIFNAFFNSLYFFFFTWA